MDLSQQEIDRILALPEKVDPFTVLGITVFVPRAPAAAPAATATDAASTAPSNPSVAAAAASTGATTGAARPAGRAPRGDDEPQPDWERAPIEMRDVTRAYRKLSLLLHPDKCSLDRAGDALHRVAEAHKKLPSEVSVERFLIELERMKRRDWDMARRRAVADEERKRKIAAGNGKSVVVLGAGVGGDDNGNGIANFNNMSMTQKVDAIAALERAERLAEVAKRAEAIARKQAEEKLREATAKATGEELHRQAQEWAGFMDL